VDIASDETFDDFASTCYLSCTHAIVLSEAAYKIRLRTGESIYITHNKCLCLYAQSDGDGAICNVGYAFITCRSGVCWCTHAVNVEVTAKTFTQSLFSTSVFGRLHKTFLFQSTTLSSALEALAWRVVTKLCMNNRLYRGLCKHTHIKSFYTHVGAIVDDGLILTVKQDKANAFNKYFSSVGV